MEIYDTIADYPKIDSNDFYPDIFRKKEFHELKDISSDLYFSHQKIVARFLSHWTLYNSLLLVHDTGTGKTGSATAVYENLRRRDVIEVLYITNNDTLIDNFKNEIVRRSSFLRDAILEETKDTDVDSDLYKRARNRVLIREHFEFYTYQTLASAIQKKELSVTQPSKLLIIMDEVHHLVVQEIEKKDSSYQTILAWLQTIPNRRLLLLTATPMRNDPSEIAPILNLMMDKQQQFPIGKQFEKEFFNVKQVVGNIALLQWKPGMAERFSHKIKGYVSVVKQGITDVRITYIGEIVKPIQYYRLCINDMKKEQSDAYLKAWDKDTATSKSKETDSSFYSHAQQASLFVFPGSLYGVAGNRKFIDKNNRLTPEFLKLTGLKVGSEFDEHNLEIISRYSSTYAHVIREIIDNPTEHIYVYCDKVNGSGIVVCIALLNTLFQFSLFKGKKMDWKQPKRRYLLLNEVQEDIKEQNFQNMINIFNDERNLFAEYVQVVFGTDKTKEGISLKRIRQIHVTTPDWNFGKVFQAIGRGVRLLSHADLDEEDREVRIFFHCAVPSTTNRFQKSIDFYRYQRSELRDQNIKLVEYYLLTSAFDCQLNKVLNAREQFTDFSPQCFYRSCKYTCRGFENVLPQELPIDYSSYDNFYIMETVHRCTDRIQQLFSTRPVWSFDELCHHIDVTPRVVFEALMVIIDTPLPIIYRGVQRCFVTRREDMLFLVDDLTLQPSGPAMLTYYAMNPSFSVGIDFQTIQSQMRNQGFNILKIIKVIIQLLLRPGDYSDHITKLLETIPPAWQQDVLVTWLLTEPVPHPFTDLLRTHYQSKVDLQKGVHHLFDTPMVFDVATSTWRSQVTTQKVEKTVVDHTTEQFIQEYITENPYKLYGYYVGDNLKIRNVMDPEKIKTTDKKLETHGKDCSSYKLKELMYFLHVMGERFPTSVDDASLQAKFQQTKSMSSEALQKVLQNSAPFNEFLKDLEIKGDDETMRFFYFYSRTTKEYMCRRLSVVLKEKNLIVLPPSKKTNK